jgi:hypothetical protein
MLTVIAVKPLKTAILAGAVMAGVTWCAVYFSIHEPRSRRMADGSISFIISCPAEDDDLTALLWAGGAYIAAFTPTLLVLRGRVSKNAFAPPQSGS